MKLLSLALNNGARAAVSTRAALGVRSRAFSASVAAQEKYDLVVIGAGPGGYVPNSKVFLLLLGAG